jgi:aminoglycoside phosphotransferase (APT) family kinase protein
LDLDTGPYAAEALTIAARFAGAPPVRLRRFATGLAHYVFEAGFEARAPIVLRLTRPERRAVCRASAGLSRQLRPLGVPLPELLADGSEAATPYLVLERLPGNDLGELIGGLPEVGLAAIAREIARIQQVVAATPSAGRYGYAAHPALAPFTAWSQVVETHVARSRSRIAGASLFDPRSIEALDGPLARLRPELDAQPATAFLHDTTTKNVIVTPDGRLSGVVDVDDLCFGDPRYPVALTHAALLNLGAATVYAERWLEAAGQIQDRLYWLYVAAFTADFMGEQGQLFNGNQRPTSKAGRDRLLQQFQRAVSMMEAAG